MMALVVYLVMYLKVFREVMDREMRRRGSDWLCGHGRSINIVESAVAVILGHCF